MSGSEQLDTLDAVQSTIAALQTYSLQLIAGLEQSGYAKEIGARNTSRLLTFRYRLDPRDTKRDVKLATTLKKYPVVAAALPDPLSDEQPAVRLHPGQAEAIISALEEVPDSVPVEDLAVAEEQMVQAAQHLSPADLRRLGKKVRNTLDTDGLEPAEDKATKRERLWLKNADHGVEFGGYLANDNAELLRTLIHAGAKPHKTADGDRDPRRRDKRQSDALVTLLELAAGSNGIPGRPRVIVTIDYDTLLNATTRATNRSDDNPDRDSSDDTTGPSTGDLIFGAPLSAATVRRMACDAGIIPIVLGSDSQPLDVGREERYVTTAIRNALIKRDGGCVICKAPPPNCHAHHIVSWLDGGPTSIDNLVLVCGGDHTDVHSGHYTLTITNGTVHVSTPTWTTPNPQTRLNLSPKDPPSPSAPAPWPRAGDPTWITAAEASELNPWGDAACPRDQQRVSADLNQPQLVPADPWGDAEPAKHQSASPGP